MDVLDNKGHDIAMDNAPIYKPAGVGDCILERGLKCVYPYSPFLNPVEEFWSKVTFGTKREAFDFGTL